MGLEDWETELVEEHLRQFAAAAPALGAAVVASADGFLLAQVAGKMGAAERLAAMTSTMLAVAAAMGRELALGQCDVLTLQARAGQVLMLSLPMERRSLLLMATCADREQLEATIATAREYGRRLALKLEVA